MPVKDGMYYGITLACMCIAIRLSEEKSCGYDEGQGHNLR